MKHNFRPFRLFSALVLVAAVSFTACKKDNDSNPSPDNEGMNDAVLVAQSNEKAAAQFNDVFNIALGVQADDAGENIGIGTGSGIIYRPGGGESTLGARCYTVNVTPKVAGQWPKTVTFDFGDGCKGVDGKVRKGKIVIVFTKAVFLTGAQVTATFDGYAVDSFAIAGQLTATNTTSGNTIGFKVQVTDGKLTNTNTGFWHEYSGIHEHVQVAGMDTPFNPLDDIYQITGSSHGGNSTGFTWNLQITKALNQAFTCRWPGSGVITAQWNQNPLTATLDFGNGDCDNKAVISYNGHSKNITL